MRNVFKLGPTKQKQKTNYVYMFFFTKKIKDIVVL